MRSTRNRSSFLSEWKSILRNRKLLISVTAVALVPLLYSSLFLWAFWDPYAKLDTLPVAVVNLDEGAVLDGKPVNVGNEFVEKIKQTDSFAWRFVDADEAMDGLKNNRYYIGLEIPKDFSAQATDVLNEKPTAALFRFYPNESYNFLSSQIGKTAVERMKGEIAQELTKTYAQTIFTTFAQLSDGLAQAADGAEKLSQGSQAVNDGLSRVNQNLGQLAAGTIPLQSGVKELNAGATRLNGGLDQLETATGQLSGGLTQLSGANAQLAQGAAQSAAGLEQLRSSLAGAEQSAAQLQAGAGSLSAGLAQWAAAHPDLAKDEALQKLIATSQQVATGTDALAAGSRQLTAGAAQLTAGGQQLQQGVTAFGQKLGEAEAGSQALLQGVRTAAAGGADLQRGLAQLSGGVSQLADGTAQLKAGADQLAGGSSQVASGSGELSDKLKAASGQTSDIKTSDATYDKIASPVQVEEDKLTSVPNYGTGFAPYFVSLGLFVGSMLLTIVFPMRETSLTPKSGFSWFIGKWGLMLSVGVIQAVIVDLVLLYGLGIDVQSVPYFMLFSVLVSWTFMSLVQVLVTAFGDPGRFLAIIILILQLTTSAGTFPLELIPEPLQWFNSWLPMTYTVAGYKAVISSGDYSFLAHNAWILGAFTIGFSLLTLAFFIVLFRKKHGQSSDSASSALSV
ncbi:YhgE/Pip family protein [Paenibacillus sp. HJGM_3]|uniref:YhgE/Pip family protein n=1 Tax=Paenibacillus sp. HJGM_3 TaxID=3379816 RepID=UPI00385D6EA8